MSGSEGVFARLESLGDWRKALGRELAALPESLRMLREGVDDLSKITKRLEVVTEVVERAQGHLDRLGVVDAARQLDDSVAVLEDQVAKIRTQMTSTAPKPLEDAMEQMSRTVASVAELGARLLRPPSR